MAERIDYRIAEELYLQYMNFENSLDTLAKLPKTLEEDIKHLFQQFLTSQTAIEMEKLPVDRINESHIGIPVAKLKTKFTNFAQLEAASLKQLTSISGIGETTARTIIETSSQIKRQISKELQVEFHQNSKNEYMLPLLTKIYYLFTLKEEFEKAKKIKDEYPNTVSMNDFHCLKNFITFSVASASEKERASSQYLLMQERLNGEYGKEIANLVSRYQAVTKSKYIQFQTYLDHEAQILQYLSKLFPTHFGNNLKMTAESLDDYNQYHQIIVNFTNAYKKLQTKSNEEVQAKEEIKKRILTDQNLKKEVTASKSSLEDYYESDLVKKLHSLKLTSITQIDDAPLATISAHSSISSEQAVQIKRTASKALSKIVVEASVLDEDPSLIQLIGRYRVLLSFHKQWNDFMITHQKEIEVYQKNIEAYKSEDKYRKTLISDLDIAKRCIVKLDELNHKEISPILTSINESLSKDKIEEDFTLHRQEYLDLVNQIVPYSYILKQVKEVVKKKEVPLIQTIYEQASILSKLTLLKESKVEPYSSKASDIMDRTVHIDNRKNALNDLLTIELIQEEEMNEYILVIEEENDATEYTDLELVEKNGKRIINTLIERFEFRQLNSLDEHREANQFKIYFIDENEQMISNEVIIEANGTEGSIYKAKFEMKNQSYLGSEYKMIMKNKKGRIYKEYPFKFDISFADDFDF